MARVELEMARLLDVAGCPVGGLDPRVDAAVHIRDGWAVTYWTCYEHAPGFEMAPEQYADALHRLHAGMQSGGSGQL